MRDLVFDCTNVGSIPAGPGYNDTAYKSCVLPGSNPGDMYVQGKDYIKASYGINSDQMAISAVATVLLWILYITINSLGKEFLNHSKGGFIRKVYKGGKAPKINTKEEEEKQISIISEAQKHLATMLTNQVCLLSVL